MCKRKTTLLEYALLGLTYQAPMSGYDLRKIFTTTAMGHFSSSPGAIYPALQRLEARSLLKATIDDMLDKYRECVERTTDINYV